MFKQSLRYLPGICLSAFVIGSSSLIVSCSPPPRQQEELTTFETSSVERSIQQFKASPTEANMKEVDLNLAKMDSEIKELEVRISKVSGAQKTEAQSKLDDLRAQRAKFQSEFTAAKVSASVGKAGESTGNALEKAGDAVKDAAESVGDTFKSN